MFLVSANFGNVSENVGDIQQFAFHSMEEAKENFRKLIKDSFKKIDLKPISLERLKRLEDIETGRFSARLGGIENDDTIDYTFVLEDKNNEKRIELILEPYSELKNINRIYTVIDDCSDLTGVGGFISYAFKTRKQANEKYQQLARQALRDFDIDNFELKNFVKGKSVNDIYNVDYRNDDFRIHSDKLEHNQELIMIKEVGVK